MIAPAPERTSTAETPAPEPEPVETFTAAELLEIILDACVHLDPKNAEAYRRMGAEHVREAVRINARLLEGHREYQRVHRITRRGRRKHAAMYRLLDVVPVPYIVVAAAWSLLPAALLDARDPDPSRRSPLRTANGHQDQ
jgi:hypothetical protein